VGRRRRAGRRVPVAGRHPERRSGRRSLPRQRRAVLLRGLRQARGRRRAWPGLRRPVDVHDFALLEWLGANSFRTSHYPYAEEFLEYADRHGVVVIDETPAVGINSGLAAGVFGAEPFTTFSEETIGATTQAAHTRAIRELIARDKNHPCVVLWSIANEPESVTPEARDYFAPLAAEARRLDPSRPVGFANVQGSSPDKDLITEYGADTYPGLHDVLPNPWTEEYQVELLEMSHRVFDRIEAVVGEEVWNFADFATAPGIMRVGGNRKGVFTRDRQPKAAALPLCRRWRGLA
jgi:beta-glucuronidase